MSAVFKSALRGLGVIIILGVNEAHSSGLGEGFVLRPSKGPFTVDSAPPSSVQANATMDGVSQAPGEEEEAPTHAIDSEQNAGDVELSRGIKLEKINEMDRDGLTPLLRAAQEGDEERVRLFVGLGVEVNQCDNRDETALHAAAQAGHAGIVRLLVQEFRVDVNHRDKYGQTALHVAAQAGHEEVVRLLAQELGVDINQRDRVRGQTALHMAAVRGHEGVVRLLVNELKADLNQSDAYGRTALGLAAQVGQEKMVRLLVNEFHVDVNQRGKYGQTALDWAVHKGCERVVCLLVQELGVDVNQRDGNGRTALHLAARRGHKGVMRLLVTELRADLSQADKYGQTALGLAAEAGQAGVVCLLVNELGTDVNQPDENHRTPLAYAVLGGELEMIDLLVRQPATLPVLKIVCGDRTVIVRENEVHEPGFGINPHQTLPDGVSLLELAVEEGPEVAVRYILEELNYPFDPLDPKIWDLFYNVILQNVAKEAQMREQFPDQDIPWEDESGAIVNYLAAKLIGCVNIPGRDHKTPLQRVLDLEEGHLLLMRFLIELGADINQLPLKRVLALEERSRAAVVHFLMRLALNSRDPIKMIDLLWWADIDIDQPDENGRTALYHAIAQGDRLIAMHLLKRGATPDSADSEGITPLHWAAFRAGFENDGSLLETFKYKSNKPYQADDQGRTIEDWRKDGERERVKQNAQRAAENTRAQAEEPEEEKWEDII